MKIYCVGFMFDDEGVDILLIQKNRPEWQAGLFNGIGGKVEISESPAAAMIREFREEAGVRTTGEDWHLFCLMKARAEALIYFYRGFSTNILEQARTMEDEPISLWPVSSVTSGALRCVPNLHWLIPMALNGVEFAEMSYPSYDATRGIQRRASTENESAHSPSREAPASQKTSPSADHLSPAEESLTERIVAASRRTGPSACQAGHESERHTHSLSDEGHWDQNEPRRQLMSQLDRMVEEHTRRVEHPVLLGPQEEEGQDKPRPVWRAVDPLESMTKVNSSNE